MRAKRTVITIASLAGALGLAAAAAMNPRVETWAVRRALAARAGPGASLAGAALGPGTASVAGLTVNLDGAVLSVRSASAQMDVLPALLGRRYHVDGLVARGWTLDLTGMRQAPESVSGAGYPWLARLLGGAIEAFKARAGVELGHAEAEGDVIFPGSGGRPGGVIHVILSGGGLGPGRTARFLCDAAAVSADPAAPVSRVSLNAVLSASMNASGAFDRADLKADASASGRDVPAGIGLSCTASASHEAGREAYSLSLVRGPERVASIDAAAEDGSRGLTGFWRLDLRDTDLAPFALGRSLPAFYVAGSGDYEADPATGDVRMTGKLQATLDRLGVVSRRMGPLGRVGLTADFDVAKRGPEIRVARFDTSVSGAQPVATVRALQSFAFNGSTGELSVAVPEDDLVGISVKGVPLSWMKALTPGLEVAGGDAHGELVMRAEDGRLVLRTRAPVSAAGVSLALPGRPLAAGLDVSAFVSADYGEKGWQLQLAPLSVRSEGIEMLSLEGRIGRLSGPGGAPKAAGSWSASVPLLLSTPAARGLPRFTAGDASGSFEASLDATRAVRVKLQLKGLAAPGAAALPAVTAEVRTDIDASGHADFNVPVHLDYGSRGVDMMLAGTLSRGSPGRLFDATLTGSRFTLEDLGTLAGLAGALPSAEGPSADGAAPQARPPWPAVGGRLAFRISELVVPHADLTDVHGTLEISPASVLVSDASAVLGEGSAAHLSGRLAFDPFAAAPYSFTADFSATGIDSAPILRSVSPDKPPVVDGLFDVALKAGGSAPALPGLLDQAQGEIKLTSRDGRFRALKADIVDSIRQAPSKLVDALDTVTSLFSKKSENIGAALVESARNLSDIHYDQMSVTAKRGPDLDIVADEITLLAPEERLSGTGRITHQDGVAVPDQPLSLDFDMGVRGQLGKFLDLVGMLKEGQDELGYTHLYQPVHLGGTLRSVDQSQWREMLVQAPLRKGTGLIDKLLGK